MSRHEGEVLRSYEGDDIPQVFVDIRLVRRIGSLSPMVMAMWQGAKGLLFLGALALTLAFLVIPDFNLAHQLRIALAVILAWQVWDQVVAHRNYGLSHILLTTKGVLMTEENLYLRWEEIDSWKQQGNLLRFKPKPGFGAKGLFAASELDVPLSQGNRELVLELFRENVARWKPE
ncbi:MAG: hypothetical protein KDB53_05455 [Planctomycetes bacterium]|nr:hypothetical protein [Planctomycetota bacterium]